MSLSAVDIHECEVKEKQISSSGSTHSCTAHRYFFLLERWVETVWVCHVSHYPSKALFTHHLSCRFPLNHAQLTVGFYLFTFFAKRRLDTSVSVKYLKLFLLDCSETYRHVISTILFFCIWSVSQCCHCTWGNMWDLQH